MGIKINKAFISVGLPGESLEISSREDVRLRIRMSLEQKNPEAFIDSVISGYHFDEKDRIALLGVYEQMQLCMTPYAVYRINQRATGNRQIDDSQTAIVAMTLGAGVDRLLERYEKDGELENAYRLECISNELLLKMYAEFNLSYARFHRRYIVKYHFIGDDIGIEKIPALLEGLYGRQNDKKDTALLGDDSITSNEYGVLTPSKSVIFYAILSENPETVCEGICVGCGNVNCENRMKKIQTAHNEKNASDTTGQRGDKNIKYNYGYQRIFGS